jgi:hypothetical protein
MSEVNYKVWFAKQYLSKYSCEFDVLKEVDILLKDKKDNYILYIESKYKVENDNDLKKALAQTILTNKKQAHILNYVALIYQNKQNDDIMELIDCTDDSVMYNNDINWKSEKPSSPTKDAIDRIWDRIHNKITRYENEEITEICKLLLAKQDNKIKITATNVNIIYNAWKNSVEFRNPVQNEQELINLFLVDALDGAKYKKKVIEGIFEEEKPLIREGIYLNKYEIEKTADKIRIVYNEDKIYAITDVVKYNNFWNKYQRPPEEQEFLNILERSARLYSDKYRRDTGGEYTPSCFVEQQNKILKAKGYDINDFIVCDTCAGVGNLENQFGIEFKQNCYLSTLEENDVEICKIKGFENTIQYDYLKNEEQPKWKHQGVMRDINEICKIENKKLMIIINPPYQRKKGFQDNLAIEFFNKILKLNPQVIIFYYQTESFFRDEIEHYIKSEYKIVSHIMSNAKITFKLSEWPISQVIFDKDKGKQIDKSKIAIDRYEFTEKTEEFDFIKTYTYNQARPNLIKAIEKQIKNNQTGLMLGNYSYMTDTINLTNKPTKSNNTITSNNLKYCLLSKGINFNTHNKYFERNQHVYRGTLKDISSELSADSIMFALFFKNCAFTNKEKQNYIMPFTSRELRCNKNDLNVARAEEGKLLNSSIEAFDFRQYLKQFDFSNEAKALYRAALQIFLYYHKSYQNTNYNDSFYDITNAIMGKDTSKFKTLDKENDTRISKTKTTEGTTGFGRNTIKSVVNSENLQIFYDFFDARDILARKINKQLVDNKLLLWERENIY